MVDRAFKIRASEKKLHLNSNIHVKQIKRREAVSFGQVDGKKERMYIW